MPRRQQILDAGEGVAAVLQPGDELEPLQVGSSVDTDAATSLWWRQ